MATNHNRAFSLVRLSVIAVCIFAVSSILAMTALTGVQSSSHEAVGAWRKFSDQASAEQRALRQFVTQAGLAGLIDDYHRLAVTGDETLMPMVYGRGGGALTALATYPVENVSEAEIAARATLQAVVRGYMGRVGPIMAMHRAGRPVAEILAAAEVDGKAAVGALQTLASATARSMMNGMALPDSKSLILLDARRLMGLEGLLQNANRFLAGSNDGALDRVRKDISNVKVALERYASHPLTAEEAAALSRLSQQVDGLEARLIADKAAGRLSFNSQSLAAALLDIEKIVYAEALTAQTNLQTTLGEVSDRAGAIIVLVGSGALALIAGAIWLLVFRVGRRINAITRTMRDLASGKLDAEIPAANDHDEIGEMSRALLVFRDGLRANAALTTELAESSRLASLGAMVAGMAHELNTPLGNALAVSSTLEEQCKVFRKDLSSERILRSVLDRHAAHLEDAGTLIQRNLVRAAEQIGSFKQMAVDQTSGRRREFHLDDVLANVTQSMVPTFKRSPFELVLGEASGVVMESYPGALSQVVTNLIENGLKHGLSGQPSGKVEVIVRPLGPHFTEIVVADSGAGIPDEVKPSIFNAFFTTKAGKGGSGLGLHIVKSIVCGPLGGQISVQSEPGSGSRFILTLPNRAPAEDAAAQTTERTYYAAAHAA
ncbi:putative Histidine kinase [uncultured Defluviicoccus sp.]|uniref:histidine kinase n=1 Tax=metagenome TaxID=256318 RepID=A0A380T7N8_9ZZZZ|nr:putative Histidine kinase [uncultured Defluviicoccus sp.]